jgi:hypothetical protein
MVRQAHHERSWEWLVTQLSDGLLGLPLASKLRWFAIKTWDDSFELTLTVRPELVEGRGKVLASIHGSTSSPRTESGVVSDSAF